MLWQRDPTRAHAVYAVALDRIVDPTLAAAAVRAVLGATAEEATHRLAAIGPRPLVLAVLREAAASAAAEALCARGLHARAIAVHDPLPGLVLAREFALQDAGIELVARIGEPTTVRFDAIDVLVHALRTAVPTPAAPQVRGVASMLGSTWLERLQQVPPRRAPPPDEEVLFLFTRDGPCGCLREQEIRYDPLGPALQPSRRANFRALTRLLRGRCSTARWDDTLRRDLGRAQLLGPSLGSDGALASLTVGAALIAASLRAHAGTPYR